jgi:hypothetical protein
MARPLKIQKIAIQAGYPSGKYGIVGGNTTLTGNQVKCRVKIGSAAEADGWIIRQKGSRKYLVSDGTNIGQCVLANTANGALLPNTMTVTATLLDASTVRLAKFGDSYGYSFTGVGYYLTFGAATAAPTGGIYAVATVTKA